MEQQRTEGGAGQPAELDAEVARAIEDVIHGKGVGSHTEWLQREYARLMEREAGLLAQRGRPRPTRAKRRAPKPTDEAA